MARFALGHLIASYPRSVKQILPESMLWTISLPTETTLVLFLFGTVFGFFVMDTIL